MSLGISCVLSKNSRFSIRRFRKEPTETEERIMKHTPKAFLALVLVLSMLSTCAGFSAFADVTTPVEAKTAGPSAAVEYNVDDNVTVNTPGADAAVLADATNGGTAQATVTGDVTSGLSSLPAVQAEANNGGDAVVNVQGDATAGPVSGSAKTVVVAAKGNESSVTVNVGTENSGGSIEATANNMSTGINATASDGGEVKVNAEAVTSTTAGGGADGVWTVASGAGSSMEVHIGAGGVTASSENSTASAVYAETSGGATTSVTVDGDVNASGDQIASYGVVARGMEDGSSTTVQTGNVTASNSEDAVAVISGTSDNGKNTVTVNGDATANGQET